MTGTYRNALQYTNGWSIGDQSNCRWVERERKSRITIFVAKLELKCSTERVKKKTDLAIRWPAGC